MGTLTSNIPDGYVLGLGRDVPYACDGLALVPIRCPGPARLNRNIKIPRNLCQSGKLSASGSRWLS